MSPIITKRPPLVEKLGERGRKAWDASKNKETYYDAPGGKRLLERDYQDLRRSGLNWQTIFENQLYSENGALVFSYGDSYTRIRPHNPRIDSKGKVMKYESPRGKPNRAYFPAGNARLDSKIVLITEGEKKALALSQAGYRAIGLIGVYGWKKKDEEQLTDNLNSMSWTEKTAYIVFDYDEKLKTRKYTAGASRQLAEALRRKGATVLSVVLPPAADGGKQGVDDFLVAHGKKSFEKLITAAVVPPPIDLDLNKPEARTDAANAARLIRTFPDIRWVEDWKAWIIFRDVCWTVDNQLRVQDATKRIGTGLWTEYKQLVNADRNQRSMLRQVRTYVTQMNDTRGISDTMRSARSDVAISASELDNEPMLMAVANGVIDLETGKCRPGNQEDMLTRMSPVAFDLLATCPTFMAFLESVFEGDRELIGYLQRWAGYSLTGDVREQIFPIFCGEGSNGKSTLAHILLSLLGDALSKTCHEGFLMEKRFETHSTELTDLEKRRLVVAIETERGKNLNETLVKQLTGGDPITARRMRENMRTFLPTHKLLLISNHKPVIQSKDYAIWRRIKLIPFRRTFSREQVDLTLREKLMAELPGILNWAIQGCLDWQLYGLREPSVVTEATREYQLEGDDVGNFLDKLCVTEPGLRVEQKVLFEEFNRHFPHSPLSNIAFGRELEKRGIQSRAGTGNKKYCFGLALRATAQIAAELRAKKGNG